MCGRRRLRVDPSRPRACTSSRTIAFGDVGQCSSQTMHGVASANGRQRSRIDTGQPDDGRLLLSGLEARGSRPWDRPVRRACSGTRSSRGGRAAPASRVRAGPASRPAGWSPLPGQTFMHSPQRTQRSRNSSSVPAPGGRIRASRGWARAGEIASRAARRRIRARAPSRTRRRPGSSGARRVRFGRTRREALRDRPHRRAKRGTVKPKESPTPFCRQLAVQLPHTKHSDGRQPFVMFGSAAPWQWKVQSRTRCRRDSVCLRASEPACATTPSSPPSGQSTRHQNRRRTQESASNARRMVARSAPCSKRGARGAKNAVAEPAVDRLGDAGASGPPAAAAARRARSASIGGPKPTARERIRSEIGSRMPVQSVPAAAAPPSTKTSDQDTSSAATAATIGRPLLAAAVRRRPLICAQGAEWADPAAEETPEDEGRASVTSERPISP